MKYLRREFRSIQAYKTLQAITRGGRENEGNMEKRNVLMQRKVGGLRYDNYVSYFV